ncbi:YybS family protein [Tenuibacillus multivorans]|uniref:Uncharacterized conserved protein YybS, DUF2232 family n=1 Tax=Tenuibacillus multivorans TaxID=237069 RepID=A0A1G9W8A5_9BACI|nr:YybS family protein [Tenuibacillus multivorans]GEL76342.1 membrane protein [Tenuibacillus multivorans]SDM80446.1 Uncharacterized conserved protein YybS, DUF2232 family [Tenuibacillus multivorans]
MNQTKAITEGAIFSAIYIVLLLLSFFIPILNIIITIALPLPFIIYTYRYGLKYSIVMFIVTAIVSSLFATVISLPVTILMGLGGMTIGFAMHRKRSSYEILAWGTVGYSVGLVIVHVIMQFLFQVNLVETIRQSMDESISMYVSMFESIGQTQIDDETIELLQEQMNQMIYKIPTWFVMTGLVFAWISQWLSYKVINRLEQTSLSFPPFREFTLPVSLIWYYLLGLILSLIYTNPGETMYLVADNLYSLAGLLLAIQGLSFVFYFTHYKNWTRFVPIIVIVLLVLQPLLVLYPLRILGIIDLGFQMRDRLSKK